MAHKNITVELAATAAKEAAKALAEAQRKYDAAQAEWERLSKRKPKYQRIEYRLTLLNWSTDACGTHFLSGDCDWHDTKASALRDAKRRVEKGTTAVIVERIDLNNDYETVAAVFGSIDAITQYGIANCPGGKKAIEAHMEAERGSALGKRVKEILLADEQRYLAQHHTA
jgi:hypothetical protein